MMRGDEYCGETGRVRFEDLTLGARGRALVHKGVVSKDCDLFSDEVIEEVSYIQVCFPGQKNGDKGQRITIGVLTAAERAHLKETYPGVEVPCVVRAVVNILRRGFLDGRLPSDCISAVGPLSETTYITSAVITRTLRYYISCHHEVVLGWDETDFAAHAIRAGGAMFYYRAGVEFARIRNMGRWKSNAIFEYISFLFPEDHGGALGKALLHAAHTIVGSPPNSM